MAEKNNLLWMHSTISSRINNNVKSYVELNLKHNVYIKANQYRVNLFIMWIVISKYSFVNFK
jgi:hypothetical protein